MKTLKNTAFKSTSRAKNTSKSKRYFLDEFKKAILEVNLIKAGKKNGRAFQELLDEL